MKLNIPEQVEPGKDDFPNHPRKVKKWLTELKQANMGDYTRQIYNGLMQLNRQSMPPKYRLENLEQLREPTRHIFSQLHKHFVNRTLPLPEKSLKIITLNQAVLNEIATGYKILIFEAANDLNKVDNKILLVACERALHYYAEYLLKSSQIYANIPNALWWDIHRIYAYAESKKLHSKKIKDSEHSLKSVSVEDYYKLILLFSLSRPNALRQSDTERVFMAMPEWIKYTNLTSHPVANKLNQYFCSKLDSDIPPHCLSNDEIKSGSNIRALETGKLLEYLKKQITQNVDLTNATTIDNQISQETLRMLITTWSLCTKRRFSRADKASDIKVAIGLTSIHNAIIDQQKAPEPKRSKRPRSTFSLESISDNERAKKDIFAQQEPTFLITHPDMKASESSSAGAWDMVAKGRALTESYARELQAQDDELGELNKEAPDLHWKISNVSAGGYCLQWNSQTTSRAQVGELIGIREKEPDHSYQWRVGVIRWMQYSRENGLEIGVQVLSPKVVTCSVRRLERKNEEPFNCLLLPGIKPLQQPATLLLPAYAFKKGGMLQLHAYERDMEIQLGTIREHTGSFTQFQFIQTDNKDAPEENDKKQSSSDDFDSIWSSL